MFDSDGTFKRQFLNVGTPTAICITPGTPQSLYIAHTGDPDGMEDAAIYKVDLDGKLVGKFGRAGKLPKEFGIVELHRLPQRKRAAGGRAGSTGESRS